MNPTIEQFQNLKQQAASVNDELIQWLERKLAEANAALTFRLESEAGWRGGTDKVWASVGCRLNRTQRLEESAMHGRIAVKCQHDVAMLKRALQIVSGKDAKGTNQVIKTAKKLPKRHFIIGELASDAYRITAVEPKAEENTLSAAP